MEEETEMRVEVEVDCQKKLIGLAPDLYVSIQAQNPDIEAGCPP